MKALLALFFLSLNFYRCFFFKVKKKHPGKQISIKNEYRYNKFVFPPFPSAPSLKFIIQRRICYKSRFFFISQVSIQSEEYESRRFIFHSFFIFDKCFDNRPVSSAMEQIGFRVESRAGQQVLLQMRAE